MKNILSFTLLALLLSACASPIPESTPTLTASPSSTPQPTVTHTPSATVTTTPGPFSEIQQRLGSGYPIVKSGVGDYYEIKGVEGVKIFEDGTSERTVNFEAKEVTLVIANETIGLGLNGELIWGVWEYKDGRWNLATSPRPISVEDAENMHKLMIVQGHAKEQAMINTIFVVREMAMAKSDTYDPANEWAHLYVKIDGKGKYVDANDLYPKRWKEKKLSAYGIQGRAYIAFSEKYSDRFFVENPSDVSTRIVTDSQAFFWI